MRRESGYMQGEGGIRTGLRDGDEEVWGRVERVRVEDRTKSDHFPVVVWIRGEVGVSRRAGGGRRRRWRWTEGKREFRERIESVAGQRRKREGGMGGDERSYTNNIEGGTGGGREKERGWWDEERRRGKRK